MGSKWVRLNQISWSSLTVHPDKIQSDQVGWIAIFFKCLGTIALSPPSYQSLANNYYSWVYNQLFFTEFT